MTAYTVRMRVPNFCDLAAEPHDRWPLGSTIRTLRVNAVNPGSAIAEAAMDLDRLGVTECELVDVVEGDDEPDWLEHAQGAYDAGAFSDDAEKV